MNHLKIKGFSGQIGKKKLVELAKKAEETQKTPKGIEKSVDQLQESMDYLRISVKYLLFDLEATRRENALLKKRLEDKEEE